MKNPGYNDRGKMMDIRPLFLAFACLMGTDALAGSSGPRYWAPLQVGQKDTKHLLMSAARCDGPEDFLDDDSEGKFADVIDCMERSGYGLFYVWANQKTVAFLSYAPVGIDPRPRFTWERRNGLQSWAENPKGFVRTERPTTRRNGEFGCSVYPRVSETIGSLVFSGDDKAAPSSSRDCGSMRW